MVWAPELLLLPPAISSLNLFKFSDLSVCQALSPSLRCPDLSPLALLTWQNPSLGQILTPAALECRKMVQMNLFPGQEQTRRCGEWTPMGWVEGRARWMGRLRLTYMHTMYKIELVGSHCMAQGAQLGALWWPRKVEWGGGRDLKGRWHIYM